MVGLILVAINDYRKKTKVNIIQEVRSKSDITEPDSNESPSISARIDKKMVAIFTKITMLAAKEPFKILLGMISLAVILCCGITQLRYMLTYVIFVHDSRLKFQMFLFQVDH